MDKVVMALYTGSEPEVCATSTSRPPGCLIQTTSSYDSGKWHNKFWRSSKNIPTRGHGYPTFWSAHHIPNQRWYWSWHRYADSWQSESGRSILVFRSLRNWLWRGGKLCQMAKGKVNTTIFVLWASAKTSCICPLIAGIRNFVVGVTVKVASDEVAMRKEKTYLNKLNLALIQVHIQVYSQRIFLADAATKDPEARMAT